MKLKCDPLAGLLASSADVLCFDHILAEFDPSNAEATVVQSTRKERFLENI